jgi:DNA-binding transcriptional ArsR family regulator
LSSRSKSASSADQRLADYDAVFAALDSAARRQILLILHFRGDRMTAGEIADRFSCSWPTTSRHLRKLESAGLVSVERAGREWIYTLKSERLAVAADWLRWFDTPRRVRESRDGYSRSGASSDAEGRSGGGVRSKRKAPVS